MLTFLIMLPFDRFYTELILISTVIHTLIHLRKENFSAIKPQVLILSSIYLLTIVCTLYTADKNQAFKDWEKQLAILLFPLILSVTTLDIKKYRLQLLKAFALSCTIICIYLFFDAFKIIRFNKLPISSILSSEFTNHNFSLPIELHATYFSMYVALSLTVVIYFLIKIPKLIDRFFWSFCCVILLLSLIQLSSRSILIAVLLLTTFFIPVFLLKREWRTNYIICSTALSAMAIFSIIRIDSFGKRFVTELKKDLSKPQTNFQTFESRTSRWECAFELFKQSPVIGYGTGSEVKLLKEKYYQKQMYVSYINEFNAHNEYLSFMLKSGILGLFIYLYVLATGFINAWQKKDFFFFSFLIIISIVSISENILDTNKGIFFFSFFLSLFASPIGEYKIVNLFTNRYPENKIMSKSAMIMKRNSKSKKIEREIL